MYQWWDSNFDWCLLHIHHDVHCIVLEDWTWQQTTSISQDDHQKTTVFAIGVARTFIITLQLRKLRISGKTKSKYHLIVLFHHTGVFRQCLSSQQFFSQLRSCNPALNALSCRPVVIWLSGSAPWLFSTTWIQLLLGRSVAQNDFNQTIFEDWPIERRLDVFLLYLVMLWKHNYLFGLKFKL